MLKFLLIMYSFLSFSFAAEEFEIEQWGLKNTGRDLEIRLSDIDFTELPGKEDEDIGLVKDLKEKDQFIKVAVIDSGIDLRHPDLQEVILKNEKECIALEKYKSCLEKNEDEKVCHKKWANVDENKNGYPLDCQGWNVAAPINEYSGVQGNNNVQDLIGHGTHVSGVIAARENGIGVKGVSQKIKIIPVKVSGSEEEAPDDSTTNIFAKGILYAIKAGAQVINLSVGWASNEDSLEVKEAIKQAHEKGILIVVAAGNSAHSAISYPCSYSEVICVGSHDPDGSLSTFTNTGASIDIVAPGRKILSTWPLDLRPKKFTIRHGYEYKDGTSFAAPFVVGVLAKLLNQGFSPEEARVKLLSGFRVPSWENNLILAGKLDYKKSLQIQPKSFIYPFKKTPALINWRKEKKKLVVKLKNYLLEEKLVKVSLRSRNSQVKVVTSSYQVEKWEESEVKEFSFLVDGPYDIDSDLVFDLDLHTKNFQRTYPIQAVAATIVHSDMKRKDSKIFQLRSKKKLDLFDFKKITNITKNKMDDFLAIDPSSKKLRLALVKQVGNNYRLSPFRKLDVDNAYILHAAKLDLNFDSKLEYALLVLKQNKELEWELEAFVFNSSFEKIDYEIFPENFYDNKTASINAEIRWIKRSNRLVPAWINYGYLPEEDIEVYSVWEKPVSNSYKKRVYYLDSDRLHGLELKHNDNNYIAQSFFKQSSEELSRGEVRLLFSEEEGFLRKYYIGVLDEINLEKELLFERYMDFSKLDPFFSGGLLYSKVETQSSRSFISHLSEKDYQLRQETIHYKNDLDPLQVAISKVEQGVFSLSRYKVLYSTEGETYVTESRNTNFQIQYRELKRKSGLYLPSNYTPGYSSELISFDSDLKSFKRDVRYRFLPYNSCSEISFDDSAHKSYNVISFYCSDKNRIIKIKI